MEIQVLKFGGTSVCCVKSIDQIIYLLTNNNYNFRYVLVFSSFDGITDALIKCAKLSKNQYHFNLDLIEIRYYKIIKIILYIHSVLISKTQKSINNLNMDCYIILNKLYIDKIISYGELISSLIFFELLKLSIVAVSWKDSRDIIDKAFLSYSYKLIIEYFNQEQFYSVILPGFITLYHNKITTTLGRGGSDYTSSIISAAINANMIEIWTDVSGIMTYDPNLVNLTYPINIIAYSESIAMSLFGVKVIYLPTILPNMIKYITIAIKNTIYPRYHGSTITEYINYFTCISCLNNLFNFTLICTTIIDILYILNILEINYIKLEYYIILITEINAHKKLIKHNQYLKIIIEKYINIISLISNQIRLTKGLIVKLVSYLYSEVINMRAISLCFTYNNISLIILKKKLRIFLHVLHENFFKVTKKQINIFISGFGKVGNQFIAILHYNKNYIINIFKLQIEVIGLSNSRMMYFNMEGIYDIVNCKKYFRHGYSMNFNILLKIINTINLINSIFVDNTASNDITNLYNFFLEKGIGVITCNKMACSSDYNKYKKLKKLSNYFTFYFETNVGAGLPILSTLNKLITSGDKIYLIEAVLSGSLNFIFNKLKYGSNLIDTISKAQCKGYTEPDPRQDLSGIDVLRKIVIIVRECCDKFELKDIKQNIFLPESCIKASSINDFFKYIYYYEYVWDYLKYKSFRLIAKYKYNNKVSVGLKNIRMEHPFHLLTGTDNKIIYTTKRYSKSPIIIKGAGAGAEVTASGVYADLMKASIR
jgi:bifunctional aspartokinase / homoserine dehydrogenase 1